MMIGIVITPRIAISSRIEGNDGIGRIEMAYQIPPVFGPCLAVRYFSTAARVLQCMAVPDDDQGLNQNSYVSVVLE